MRVGSVLVRRPRLKWSVGEIPINLLSKTHFSGLGCPIFVAAGSPRRHSHLDFVPVRLLRNDAVNPFLKKVTGTRIKNSPQRSADGCERGLIGMGCPFRNPAFTLPTYPALDPEHMPGPGDAQHGVLGQLDGTWVNAPGVWGIHLLFIISQIKP